MRTYMEQLRKQSDTTTNITTISTRKEYTPLEIQIQQLMVSLPENQRRRDWSMADLIARLKGRYRDKPHAQKVGEALKKSGWTQYRDYSRAGGGRRMWRYPKF